MCLGNLRTYTETGIAGLNINLFGIGEQFWTPLNKGYAVICSDPKGEPKKTELSPHSNMDGQPNRTNGICRTFIIRLVYALLGLNKTTSLSIVHIDFSF